MKVSQRKLLRQIAKVIGFTSATVFGFLLLWELAYRNQWIETYASELTTLNSEVDLEPGTKPTLLVFGDSFSASPDGYVSQLRSSLPDYRIINASIPGSSPVQGFIIANNRINSYPPGIAIIQVYVGNDLNDIDHSISWGEVSFARNIYWLLSDKLRGLSYLNYTLGQWAYGGKDIPDDINPKEAAKFDIAKFQAQEKMLIAADPNFIVNSIRLENGREETFDIFEDKLEGIADLLPPECKILILCLPHPVQIHDLYRKRWMELGASTGKVISIPQEEYRFLDRLRLIAKADSRIRVIDPLDQLREAEEERGPIYFANDPHLNPEGQKVLHKFVLDELNSILE